MKIVNNLELLIKKVFGDPVPDPESITCVKQPIECQRRTAVCLGLFTFQELN